MHRRAILGGFIAAGSVSMVDILRAAERLAPAAASSFVLKFIGEAVPELSLLDKSDERRVAIIGRLISHYVDENLLSQHVLGDAWSIATAEQRSRFRRTLFEFVINACATASAADEVWPGTRAVVTGATMAGDRTFVQSFVYTAPDEKIGLEWVITNRNGRLVITDVLARGVSLVGRWQSEARCYLLENSGDLDGLTAILDRRIKNLVAQRQDAVGFGALTEGVPERPRA